MTSDFIWSLAVNSSNTTFGDIRVDKNLLFFCDFNTEALWRKRSLANLAYERVTFYPFSRKSFIITESLRLRLPVRTGPEKPFYPY
jgi:hypothetical protein